MAFDRKAWMKTYMANRRAGLPQLPSKAKRMKAVCIAVREELENSNTDKGKRLYQMAVDALGETGGSDG